MLNELKKEANITYTENRAVTNRSSMSACLDLFGTAGALRNAPEDEIMRRFIRAYAEDKTIAMKILFFARDIHGGLGERRFFRTIFKNLADTEPELVRKNLEPVAEYGRFDDLLVLVGTACEKDAVRLLGKLFRADLNALKAGEDVSLLGKWLPSVNTSSQEQSALGKKLAKAFGMSESEYRKSLSALRKAIRIIENNLREKDYTFDYGKQTSRALYKYRKAFLRNDNARYTSYIQAASVGNAKINTSNIYPYELVEQCLNHNGVMTCEEKAVINATWKNLPEFCNDENALAVVDGSGSMYRWGNPRPASVALSLGLYFAEHNKGEFANHFITFSRSPQLVDLKDRNFVEKLRYAKSFNEVADTDIEAVFRLVLDTAVKNHISQEEMPAKLVIISDMEFNYCTQNASLTNFENAKKMYEEAGYVLPQLVFWNVQSRNAQQPVTMHETGTALVSGCTPRIFSMVAGEIVDPYTLMMEVIGSERYAAIAA